MFVIGNVNSKIISISYQSICEKWILVDLQQTPLWCFTEDIKL